MQRFLSQPFFVAEVFTGLKGEYVPVAETVESFEAIVNGDLDEVPEQAFLNVGGIEQVPRQGQGPAGERGVDARQLVSPEEVLFEGEATPGRHPHDRGRRRVPADHAPFLGTLVAAETRVYLADGSIQRFDLDGGFVEVSGNSVTILAT